MGTHRSADENAVSSCVGGFRPDDLAFLLHAATDRMVTEVDRAAVEIGLKDSRDWFVLAALDNGQQHTQLELSRMVCVDKTTLIGVLDRLEKLGLMVRTADPKDRRVRIPQITAKGRKVHAKFAQARDAAEARVLDGMSCEQRGQLLDLLARVAEREPAASLS
ncbi:MAG: MarR family transcriptional regulator [Actinomycetales bacterium]|nr:MAG: MarR family transcriptional regulator [Actinomycetales bacterium]